MLILISWILLLVFMRGVIGDEKFEPSIFPSTSEAYIETTGFEIFNKEATSIVEEITDDFDSFTIESVTKTTFIPFSTTPPTPIKLSMKKNPIVNVQEGALKGVYKKGFYHFMGIKYGQAPIGERRFKPALPEQSWEGVRNAQQFGSVCPHTQLITQLFLGNEDCLFLNVFTKMLPTDKTFDTPMPVMVWLHGGAFKAGSGNFPLTGPDFLVNEDVVVVTLNYRLGSLGFLCIDQNARGNMGLHDQVLALKWIKRNIGAFGGDPEKVTIFGFSAGAVSVDILMLSKTAEGLFRSAIAQSGSVLAPWSFVQNPKMQAFRLGHDLGFKGGSTEDLVEFLKKVPTKLLVEKSEKLDTPPDERNSLSINFTPCVEDFYENTNDNGTESHEPIIIEVPSKTLLTGNYKNIPYISGFAADEAILVFKNILMDPKAAQKFKTSDMYFIPANINISNVDKPEVDLLAEDINHVYIGLNKNVSPSKVADAMVKYGTDVYFLYGMTRTLRHLVRNGNKHVYSYRFAFDGAFNFYKRFVGFLGAGVAHGDDLGYIFTAPSYLYMGVNLKDVAKREIICKNRMVKLWSNFAKYGNPTPLNNWESDTTWEPIKSSHHFTYLDISDDLTLTEGMPNQERVEFWDEVYREYEAKSANKVGNGQRTPQYVDVKSS